MMMLSTQLCALALTYGVSSVAALAAAGTSDKVCQVLPGDAAWPSEDEWNALNKTVGGRLIKTIPRGAVCHNNGIAAMDDDDCTMLSSPVDWPRGEPYYQERVNLTIRNWDIGPTYTELPAEVMNPYWHNQTCDPFTPAGQPCELGNLAVYSIDVSNAKDVQEGMKFAKQHNIRIAIKNSGHDYLGKSSGRGSLGLWTHNLQDMEVKDKLTSGDYTGPAIKVGAGINVGQAMMAVKNKYRVVGGECGTVGIAGGYSQGGGHSILNTAHGMGADQVLEWELVTGEGKHVIATPDNEHQDLYWALSGGGGGSYGVVLSMTAKLHPEGPVAGASLTFYLKGVSLDTYWEAVAKWFQYLPILVADGRSTLQFVVWNDQMDAQSINLLDHTEKDVDRLLGPFLRQLDSMGITYRFRKHQSETYFDHFDHYYGPLPDGIQPSSTMLNSRLIPRDVVQDYNATKKLAAALRVATESGEFLSGCTAMDTSHVSHSDNAVLPAWRDAIAVCIMNAFWNYHAPLSKNIEVKNRMNEQYMPLMEDATPGAGVYLNEIDPLYRGDWKQSMYGANYDKLLEIKNKHDPDHLFYGHFAVGGDEYTIDDDGRLCYDEANTGAPFKYGFMHPIVQAQSKNPIDVPVAHYKNPVQQNMKTEL